MWEGTRSAAALGSTACAEWSSACRKPPPKTPKAREPGPAFHAYTDEQRAEQEARSGRPPARGMLSAAALRQSLGFLLEEDDATRRANQHYGTERVEASAVEAFRRSPAFTSNLVAHA